MTRQSSQISQGVTATTSQSGDQGAGDQGIMFGYATDESAEMMPLPILLAHKLTKGLTDDRKQGKVDFLRPDSKSQVSVLYENNEPKEVTAVVISTQHTPAANQKQITEYVREQLGPRALQADGLPCLEAAVRLHRLYRLVDSCEFSRKKGPGEATQARRAY